MDRARVCAVHASFFTNVTFMTMVHYHYQRLTCLTGFITVADRINRECSIITPYDLQPHDVTCFRPIVLLSKQ